MNGVTDDDCLLFSAKVLLHSLSICYCLIENHFSVVERPQTHLVMSFNSIRIMAGYILKSPKINVWSD